MLTKKDVELMMSAIDVVLGKINRTKTGQDRDTLERIEGILVDAKIDLTPLIGDLPGVNE